MMIPLCDQVERGMVCSLPPGHVREHIFLVESPELTRACHDTMRELAAVAGLALWVEQRGRFVSGDLPAPWLAAFAKKTFGWEAPDA